ncbi:hypothetical protein AQB9606_03198 [Aquabacterium sp. CECT 9606]|nr:hypothetical protein AQB9606_03198 [Aquabacterium sp. CECT 9606]
MRTHTDVRFRLTIEQGHRDHGQQTRWLNAIVRVMVRRLIGHPIFISMKRLVFMVVMIQGLRVLDRVAQRLRLLAELERRQKRQGLPSHDNQQEQGTSGSRHAA